MSRFTLLKAVSFSVTRDSMLLSGIVIVTKETFIYEQLIFLQFLLEQERISYTGMVVLSFT
jgi:hypothetical protein